MDILYKNGTIIHHIANTVQYDGGFTICGIACDDVMEYDNHQMIGDWYDKGLKHCNCEDCRRILIGFRELK